MTSSGTPLAGEVPPLPAALGTQPAIKQVGWAPPTRRGQRFGRETEAALRPALGDEQIIAAAKVLTDSQPRAVVLGLALIIPGAEYAQIVDGRLHTYSQAAFAASQFIAAALAGGAPALADRLRGRVLLVSTGQRLACWRLSRLRHRPVRELFVIPLAAAHITGLKASTRVTVITCDRPGGKPLKLTASGAQRKHDLSKVIATAQQAGAWFEIPAPGRRRIR
jgi:hypothetical protein